MADYGAIRKVPRVSALRVPLKSYEDLSAFKLFCIDVGLLGALADLQPSTILDGSKLSTEFKGALTEQYVEQELVHLGFPPFIGHQKKAPQKRISASHMTAPYYP